MTEDDGFKLMIKNQSSIDRMIRAIVAVVILANPFDVAYDSVIGIIALTIAGVLIFAGLTAWDTQRIKSMYMAGDAADVAAKKSIFGALTLYLDFINMFLFILRLFGNRE